MFDNVTYTFYSDTLGRAIIPTSDDFDSLKLVNIQLMKRLLPYIKEYETNGIDSAVCMMIEVDYKSTLAKSDKIKNIASESVGGHSVSYDNAATQKLIELDTTSTYNQKIKAIKLFCSIDMGV